MPLKQRTDILGEEINVGDFITYGTGQGGIRVGRVEELKRKDVERYDYQTKTRVWVEEIKLKVSVPATWRDNRKTTLSESCAIVKIGSETARLIREAVDAPSKI